VRTQTCRDHCSACGQHFASEAAFDAHRAFLGEPGDWSQRGCLRAFEVVKSDGSQLLEAVAGECRISEARPDGHGMARVPAEVWRVELTEAERARLEALREAVR
jgi:hypothetical protein